MNGLRDLIGPSNPLTILALILAGVVHDVGHPGVNNAFLIASKDRLAIRYNDRSVLENFHSSVALRMILLKYAAEWKLSETDTKFLRSLLIGLVLSTDMAQHFEIISKFKALLGSPNFNLNENDNLTHFLCLAIKTADISNVMRPHAQMLRWVSQLTQEFFSQGDRERDLHLPVSPFTDRSDGITKLSKLQTNFIELVAEPLVATLHKVLPVPLLTENMAKNSSYWSSNPVHHIDTSNNTLEPGPASSPITIPPSASAPCNH